MVLSISGGDASVGGTHVVTGVDSHFFVDTQFFGVIIMFTSKGLRPTVQTQGPMVFNNQQLTSS